MLELFYRPRTLHLIHIFYSIFFFPSTCELPNMLMFIPGYLSSMISTRRPGFTRMSSSAFTAKPNKICYRGHCFITVIRVWKFCRDRVQSHLWLTVSSYRTKYSRISSYISLGSYSSGGLYTRSLLNFLINEKKLKMFLNFLKLVLHLHRRRLTWGDKWIKMTLLNAFFKVSRIEGERSHKKNKFYL